MKHHYDCPRSPGAKTQEHINISTGFLTNFLPYLCYRIVTKNKHSRVRARAQNTRHIVLLNLTKKCEVLTRAFLAV
jgi:hypothetical protein